MLSLRKRLPKRFQKVTFASPGNKPLTGGLPPVTSCNDDFSSQSAAPEVSQPEKRQCTRRSAVKLNLKSNKTNNLHSLAENWWIDLYAAKDGQVSACDLPPMEKDIIAYRTVLNRTVWWKQDKRWVGQHPSWDVCKPGGQLQERSDLCDCQQGFCHQVLNHVLWIYLNIYLFHS